MADTNEGFIPTHRLYWKLPIMNRNVGFPLPIQIVKKLKGFPRENDMQNLDSLDARIHKTI